MTPCREWQGHRNRAGYGNRNPQTKDRSFKSGLVHRQIIEMVGTDQYGNPLEDGLVVMHLCDNPACYRYDHLRVGTVAENVADTVAKDRHDKGSYLAAQTHCKRGHVFDPENTYIDPQGWRHCRTCKRATKARHRTNQKKAATS